MPSVNVYVLPEYAIVFPSFNEIFLMAEMGIEDGAVKYQICFAAKFDFLKSVEVAVVEETMGRGLNDGGRGVTRSGFWGRGLAACFAGSEGVFLKGGFC